MPPKKVEFETNPQGSYAFREKHVRTITGDVTVQSQIDKAAQVQASRRGLNANKVAKNTLICMTLGQQQSLFAWLEKNKASELSGLDANGKDIPGIPIPGCIIDGDKAYGGGTFTLGIKKAKGGAYAVYHLGRWDRDGRYPLATSRTLSANEKDAFKA